MNPNYFNRNLFDSMKKSVEDVILNESAATKKVSAVKQQAIEANEARRETQAKIKAKAQELANTRLAAAGQKPGAYGAEDYKAAMAELKADPEFVGKLDVANRFRGWGGGFGGASQRTGDLPVGGMAERAMQAMSDQAQRDRLKRLAGMEKTWKEQGWESNGAFRPLDVAKAEAASAAESETIRKEEQGKFDREQYEDRKKKADEILKASYAKSGRTFVPKPTSTETATGYEKSVR